MKTNWIAINQYRSSTSDGFGNTWAIYRCQPETRKRLLAEGLPVADQCVLRSDGTRETSYSTMGIRAATAQEIRNAKRHGAEWWEDRTNG